MMHSESTSALARHRATGAAPAVVVVVACWGQLGPQLGPEI